MLNLNKEIEFIEEKERYLLDLTPLVDVLFILLIFFLVGATFAKPYIELSLPEAKSAKPIAEKNILVFSITADGKLLFNQKEINPEEINNILVKYPEWPINLFVDRNADFGLFIKVVDQFKLNGRNDFLISVMPEE